MSAPDFAALTQVVAHRPYPLPDRPWVMTMSWHDLLFAHWRVDVGVLRALVPASLPLDLHEGGAYIGVVPFRMTHVSARGVPDLPFVSAFCELNVRTYVVVDGKPGVYFFSLDAANALAVWGARTFFHLPYFSADMELAHDGDGVAYRSDRDDARAPAALGDGIFRARYAPSGAVFASTPGSLEAFLTERYCLYAVDDNGRPMRGEIHHAPWPLQPATARIDACSVAPVALERSGAPILHFARRLDVIGWALESL